MFSNQDQYGACAFQNQNDFVTNIMKIGKQSDDDSSVDLDSEREDQFRDNLFRSIPYKDEIQDQDINNNGSNGNSNQDQFEEQSTSPEKGDGRSFASSNKQHTIVKYTDKGAAFRKNYIKNVSEKASFSKFVVEKIHNYIRKEIGKENLPVFQRKHRRAITLYYNEFAKFENIIIPFIIKHKDEILKEIQKGNDT